MFPVREIRRHWGKALAALFIATQILFLGFLVYNYSLQPKTENNNSTYITGLKDNWELISVETKKTNIDTREKISNLAAKYKSDPEYLHYIIQVEKTFKLEPCDLLALIAQESGFKPQTHMDGGSLSYSTTQMKMPTAKTAYMAITEYYNMEIPYPTDELLREDKNYAAFLAGGYLRYLNDTYKNKYESYTAYNFGIGGRMIFYQNNGHFKSPYAIKVASLGESFVKYVGNEYDSINKDEVNWMDVAAVFKKGAPEKII
ncbi:MAG: transglycosylase SLT domain-containing protein [Peptococcaceae bacterium]|nr:transglycosylase SLT domain-containing protein [Peptococcaceae bacterium]